MSQKDETALGNAFYLLWVACTYNSKDSFVFGQESWPGTVVGDSVCAFPAHSKMFTSPYFLSILQAVLLSELHLRWKGSLLWTKLKLSTGHLSVRIKLLGRQGFFPTLDTERNYCFFIVCKIFFNILMLITLISEEMLEHSKVPFIPNM